MERSSGPLSITEYLLAKTAILGRARRVAECMEFCIGKKKRGSEVGKTKRGKGSKWMVVVDGQGIPLGGTITSASPAEVTLIEQVLNQSYGKSKIQRLIYDKAADSDPLRVRLAKRGIDLICPHRINRRKVALQDGRKRRYSRRWIVERTISWLGNYRRLLIRWERYLNLYTLKKL
jgi:IS5 family transposase